MRMLLSSPPKDKVYCDRIFAGSWASGNIIVHLVRNIQSNWTEVFTGHSTTHYSVPLLVCEVLCLQQPSIQDFSHMCRYEVHPPPTEVDKVLEKRKWRLVERVNRSSRQGTMRRSYEAVTLNLQIPFTSEIVGINAKETAKTKIRDVVTQVQLASEQTDLVHE